jgi:hypothetical protein
MVHYGLDVGTLDSLKFHLFSYYHLCKHALVWILLKNHLQMNFYLPVLVLHDTVVGIIVLVVC